MSGWFVGGSTYTRKVVNEETKELADVTFRVMNAGDQAAIQDAARYEFTEEDVEGGEEEEVVVRTGVRFGRSRLLTVHRAVVSWTIPGPAPTVATIADLPPSVFEQLFDWASFGKVPREQTDEELLEMQGLKAVVKDEEHSEAVVAVDPLDESVGSSADTTRSLQIVEPETEDEPT